MYIYMPYITVITLFSTKHSNFNEKLTPVKKLLREEHIEKV